MQSTLNSNLDFGARQGGSALLEGMIAILIFSVGVLALVGLQATAMKATTASKDRIDASLIANRRIAEIWVDWKKEGGVNFAESNTVICNNPSGTHPDEVCKLINAKRTTAFDAADSSRVVVTVSWQSVEGGTQNTFQTSAQIAGNS